MPSIRPRVVDVTALVSAIHADEVGAAAHNHLLSKPEQASAPAHIADAAQAVRERGGPGARVTVADLEAELLARTSAAIGAVNQSTGSGAVLLSQAEAKRAGGHVLHAWQILAGRGVDAAAVARTKVSAMVTDPADQVFVELPTEHDAERYVDPNQRSVTWLVVTADSALKTSFVWGRNDLWAERFDVSKLDGSVVTTGEH